MKIVMNRRLPIGIAILSCLIGSGVGATMSRSSKATPLIIRNGACHFSPEIERRLGLLRDSYRRYAERHNIDLMVEHVSQAAAQFAFGPLHGVALEHVNDAEWDGDTMYFSEDMTTAANALQKMGFHVGRHGYILESKTFEDSDGLYVEVAKVTRGDADHPKHFFPGARSYLACGSF